ncbi:MAG: anaerobic sulfite reductase subunit AsrA [Lachnospiraceae bacterium]|nr:anaerobic sulfite reductase subunit AsrA [Lachnospiraceae bacterium]MDY4971237.1 anaerobic sulfite reductase subunit AsrA [Lachnospiraceae bacterium]
MGYVTTRENMDTILASMSDAYDIFAPKVFEGEGCFSDQDSIRYGKITSLDEMEWERKSEYSFKEALLAVQENLFYFTEDQVTVPKISDKGILIFLRSCDLAAVKRLDQIYLNNGPEDFYYKRLREKAKFILMGCTESCASGFCVSMGTNQSENYDLYLKTDGNQVFADCKDEALAAYFAGAQEKGQAEPADVKPDYVTENAQQVTLPRNLSVDTFKNSIWEEYGNRCIGCGRCNFVCPTCTCFTMQDVYYQENAKVGERRRVWASCQVDGYTDMAGGHAFRKSQGERMRFKVMHKIYDFEKRFGYPMCVGCGRCDDVCPEYISYANCVNRLAKEEQ